MNTTCDGTTYLVDTENIPCRWSVLVSRIGTCDKLVLFVSEKSEKAAVSLPLGQMDNLFRSAEIITVTTGTKNALDFQLVTELTYRFAAEPKRKYVVVSNDRGYEAAFDRLKAKGASVSRIGAYELSQMIAQPAQAVPARSYAVPQTVCPAAPAASVASPVTESQREVAAILAASRCSPDERRVLMCCLTDCIVSCRRNNVPKGDRYACICRSVYQNMSYAMATTICCRYDDVLRRAAQLA